MSITRSSCVRLVPCTLLKLLISVVDVPTLAIATPAALSGPPSTGLGSDWSLIAFSFNIILPVSETLTLIVSMFAGFSSLSEPSFLISISVPSCDTIGR